MTVKRLIVAVVSAMTALFAWGGAALAEGRLGVPTDKAVWLQEVVNEQGRRVSDFNEMLLYIILVIAVFVFILMFYVLIRFRAKANPQPSKTSHNTLIEFVWTVVPILILVGIGFWSIPLLYYQETIPETEFAVRVTGNQWNWTYSYPDHDGIEFTAAVVPDSAFVNAEERDTYERDLSAFLGRPAKMNARLLDTDLRMVVPEDTKIKIMLTASDVIHAWTVPAFGVKLDAVPGRLNETWFEVDEIGTYYGQCSELCGKDHAFMPIAVEVVSKEDFAKWIAHAKTNYAMVETGSALGR